MFGLPALWRVTAHAAARGRRVPSGAVCGTTAPPTCPNNKVLLLTELCGWAPREVTNTAFNAKWAVGRARPEECADMIASRGGYELADLTAEGCMPLTSYVEGSPNHPSWPAMHGCAASASLVLKVVMDLDECASKDMELCDWNVAQFRSLAGVHHIDDNTHGLCIGQACITAALPKYLASVTGADPKAVRNKCELVQADWIKMHDEFRESLQKRAAQ